MNECHITKFSKPELKKIYPSNSYNYNCAWLIEKLDITFKFPNK